MIEHSVDIANPPTLEEGRYLITGIVGRGGNATVYQAWDTTLLTWRAIKILKPDFVDNDEVRARFAQEAATMARLDHPNLVKVYDISDHPFMPHIVMELCAGGAIIDWMKEHGGLPHQAVLSLLRQTTEAVGAAHEAGIIHRDVKPQNILVDQYGVAKLTDFGIARNHDNHLTMAGATVGTYAFMAPEQRHDSTTVDERTDIYSLGASLFTMLQVKTTTELFVAEEDDPLFDGLPQSLVALILRCCAYRPHDRFQSITELIEAIDATAATLPADPVDAIPLNAMARSLPPHPPEHAPDSKDLEDFVRGLALAHTNDPLDPTTMGHSQSVVEHPLEYYNDPTAPGPPQRSAPVAILTPAPPPVRRTRAMTWLPLSAAVFALGMAAFGSSVAAYGKIQVDREVAHTRKAEQVLVEAVLASRSALDEIDVEHRFDDLYFGSQNPDPNTASVSARALAAELETLTKANPPTGDNELLIRNVLQASVTAEAHRARWVQTANHPSSLLAISLGVAPSP